MINEVYCLEIHFNNNKNNYFSCLHIFWYFYQWINMQIIQLIRQIQFTLDILCWLPKPAHTHTPAFVCFACYLLVMLFRILTHLAHPCPWMNSRCISFFTETFHMSGFITSNQNWLLVTHEFTPDLPRPRCFQSW